MSLWVLVWVFPISYLVAFADVGHSNSTCTRLWVGLALGGLILPALGWANRYRLFRKHPDKRVGWYAQRSMVSPRRVFYAGMRRTVRLSEPAELRSRREAWSQFQNSPQRTFAYGEALEEAEEVKEALSTCEAPR